MNNNDRLFFTTAVERLTCEGVNVHLHEGTKIDGCSGWFEHPNLKVAAGNEDWFEIFVHEYCHFLQHLDERDRKRVNYEIVSSSEFDAFFGIVDGIYQPADRLTDLRHKIQLVEQDCDVRVVQLIKQHDLSIDVELYIRKSNAYHASYALIQENRTWTKLSPYRVDELVNACPNEWFTSNELLNPPRHLSDLIQRYCF